MNQTLYESTDNGTNWQKTVITTPASNFYVDDLMVGSDGKLYALNYSQIYVSTDGTNWTNESSGQFYGMYRIMEFGPDKFLALSGWNGVYVAKTVAGPWTKILSEVSYTDNYRIIANSYLVQELRNHVAHEIGPIAKPRQIMIVPELPKTRSGKIMRRLLKDVAENREVGDVTTLADSSVMNMIQQGLTAGSSSD